MANVINSLIALIVAFTHTELTFSLVLEKVNTIISAAIPDTEDAGKEFILALHQERCGIHGEHVFRNLPPKAKEGAALVMGLYEWGGLVPTLYKSLEEYLLEGLPKGKYDLMETDLNGRPAIAVMALPDEEEGYEELIMAIALDDFYKWEVHETSPATLKVRENIRKNSLYPNEEGIFEWGEVKELFA